MDIALSAEVSVTGALRLAAFVDIKQASGNAGALRQVQIPKVK